MDLEDVRLLEISESEEEVISLDEEPYGKVNDAVRMYLKEMGSVSLLSREEEIELGEQAQLGDEVIIK